MLRCVQLRINRCFSRIVMSGICPKARYTDASIQLCVTDFVQIGGPILITVDADHQLENPMSASNAFGSCRLPCVAVLLTGLLAGPVLAEEPAKEPKLADASNPAPAAAPTPKPKYAVPDLNERQKRQRLFDYLEKLYLEKYESPDWVTRSMAIISLGKLPTRKASNAILEAMENDKHEVVRLIAFEAMLSRAEHHIHGEHYDRWLEATGVLANAGLFNGPLRVGLIQLLSVNRPSPTLKGVWWYLFEHTNSTDRADITSIKELAECLKTWQAVDIVDRLITTSYDDLNQAYRAHYIMHLMGCPVDGVMQYRKHTKKGGIHSEEAWAKTKADVVAWWKTERRTWTQKKEADKLPWKNIKANLLPAVPVAEEIDLDELRKDLELEMVRLGNFDLAFVVDATGSMGEVHNWLRRDMRQMLKVFHLVAREPRIGLTFYRDEGDEWLTKETPLTDDIDSLNKALGAVGAKGGGDIPESVLNGLHDGLVKQPWTRSARAGRNLMVIIADAPPHEETIPKAVALAEKAHKRAGMRIFGVTVHTSYGKKEGIEACKAAFDQIAEVAGGTSIEIRPQKNSLQRNNAIKHFAVARERREATPGEQILYEVLVGAMNPQYRNRILPFVQVAVAFCQEYVPEKREPWKSPSGTGGKKGGGKKKDRQAQ